MQKIKFDFEATKQIIDVAPDASVRIGAPVNANGVLANDGTAIGIVLDAQGVGVHRQLVVMVAGYCDIIDAQAIWGDEYSAEAMAAMSDITFCDNHELPTGGGGGGEVVTVTIDYDSGTATMDKTFEEILSLDNPRFVSNLGVPFYVSYVMEEEIDLYSLGFNNVGGSQPQAKMYIESIIAYPNGDVTYGGGEYSLTSV